MSVTVDFLEQVAAGDPLQRPCTILGKKGNVQSLSFDKVSPYLGDKVTEEVAVYPKQLAKLLKGGINAFIEEHLLVIAQS